ncbi:MAG TPA: hypothetical protein DCQ67_10255 [Acidimicrobiaceae bacterium]|jgi:hypothetical protein|nr:hypothetical protein [Acidimicrobiaceae bacterium]
MARGETIGAAKLRQHVRQCLRCQAEMSRERRIQRELHSLKNEISVPDGLNDQILDSIETIDRRPIIVRRQRSKVAGFCALGVALVLGLGSRPVRRLAARAS